MYTKIDDAIVLQIDDYTAVFDAIVYLRNQYMDTDFTARHAAGQKLFTTTLGRGKNDVDTYIQAMYACMEEADSVECGFPEWWIVSCLIANLDGRYKDFT